MQENKEIFSSWHDIIEDEAIHVVHVMTTFKTKKGPSKTTSFVHMNTVLYDYYKMNIHKQ